MISENSYLTQAEIDLTNRIKESGVRYSSMHSFCFVPTIELEDPCVAKNYELHGWFESALSDDNCAEIFWSKPIISRFLSFYSKRLTRSKPWETRGQHLPIYFFLSNKMVNCVLGKVDFKYLWAEHRLADSWYGKVYLSEITKLHNNLSIQYDAIKNILKENFEQLLVVMSEDQDPLVRRAAAMAPNSPQSVIKKLLLDSDDRVAEIATKHEHSKDLVIFF